MNDAKQKKRTIGREGKSGSNPGRFIPVADAVGRDDATVETLPGKCERCAQYEQAIKEIITYADNSLWASDKMTPANIQQILDKTFGRTEEVTK